MHGLRVERHQLEHAVRDLGADRKAELSRFLRGDRVVVGPGAGRQLLRQRFGLVRWKPPCEEPLGGHFDLVNRLAADIREDQRLVVDLGDGFLIHHGEQ
jgi:hypothetical protein